jgi:hypothetical protein
VALWGSGAVAVARWLWLWLMAAVADGGTVAEWQSGRVAAWHWECGCLALAQWLLGTGRVAVALAEWHSGTLGYLALKVIKSREKKKRTNEEKQSNKNSHF